MRRATHRRLIAVGTTALIMIAGMVSATGTAQAAPTATAGGQPAQPPACPSPVTPATSVPLSAAFDNVAISDASHPGDIDGTGNSLSQQSLNAAELSPGAGVMEQGISYTWPNVAAGQPDNVVANGQTLALSGSGSALGFLGLAVSGQHSGTGTITYSDGSTQTFTLTFNDWFTNSAAGTSDQQVASAISAGLLAGTHVGVYAAEVPLDATTPIASVTLPVAGQIHIFAIGIDQPSAQPLYLDTRYSFSERAADLVSCMTLAEKSTQLQDDPAPAIPRLGVASYMYGNEGQHGVIFGGNFTSFPVNFASTMSWDPKLVYQETTAVSDEARAKGVAAGLTYWAPTVNMDRDPRWGRTDEAFGEDPYLVGQMAGAFVDGYQGETMTGKPMTPYLKVAATAKHFAMNNVEANRTSGSSNTTDANVRDYYTSQFKTLTQNAHLAGVMTSYNAINGTPAPADTYTANELLQRTYGFDGYTTSDCGAVGFEYQASQHDWAPPGWSTDGNTWTNTTTGQTVPAEAGGQAYALRAGTQGNCIGTEPSLANIEAAINAGVLSQGVLDNALVHLFTIRMETGEFDPTSRVAYDKIGTDVIQSPANQALAEKVAANDLVLLKNDNVTGTSAPLLPADPAKLNNVVILGNLANTVTLGDYSGTPTLQVNAVQGITSAVKAANPNATVTFDACGTSTTATTPASCSAATQAAIASADLVIVFVGTDSNVATEGLDRSSLAMPGNYDSLINQVDAIGNPHTALVIQSGGPVDIADTQGDFPAIVFSGYNGESQGTALAQVLFGQQDPAGHLDFTWFKDDSQLPDIMNYGLTPSQTGGLGRTYMYFTGTPTYPFGYGLSYSHFRYSHLTIRARSVNANGTVPVSFAVTNTGRVRGATVAQLYVSPQFTVPGVELPKEQLAGFQRTVTLAPGQTQHITLQVKVADLSRWDESRLKEVVYDGRYQFRVGPDSADVAGAGTVTVHGAITPQVQTVTVQPDQVVFTPGQRLDLTGKNPWIAPDTNASLEQPHAAADNIVEAANNDESFVNLAKARVSYRSSNPRVAAVSRTGQLTAVGRGVATISVTVDGVTGSTPIVVQQPLTITAPTVVTPGSTVTVTTALPNTGARPISNAAITLTVPGGWTATATTAATFATVEPGQTAQTTWDVAVPADATSGSSNLTATADFTDANGAGEASAIATTQVPVDQTVSCTLGQTNACSGMALGTSVSDGVTQPVTVDGESARQTVEAVPNDLNMYFNIDDGVAVDGSFTATFTVEYYDGGTNAWNLQYDSTNPAGPLSGAFTLAGSVQETGSDTWKTVTFTVNDARFDNRANSNDWRISSGSPVIVHSASVHVTGVSDVAG